MNIRARARGWSVYIAYIVLLILSRNAASSKPIFV